MIKQADYSYLCGDRNKLNYLCLSCLNHELNQEKRADRHYTDNQDYNDFNNNRLGGREVAGSNPVIPTLKGFTSICRAFFIYYTKPFSISFASSTTILEKRGYVVERTLFSYIHDFGL